jgi:hypothetical protein
LRSRHSLEEIVGRYGQPFSDWSEVPVPRRRQPAFGLFLEYMDYAWIERFFLPAQAVFPRLSMEIRVDGDAVWSDEGTVAYYHRHHASWNLPGAAWTTLYWAPSMNGLNQGETLSPETAAERLEATLRGIREVTGDRALFIGQFLVEDHTPGFERNGRLDRDRIPDFLDLAAGVLHRQAHGYALWAWRDYRHNAIPSPDFSRVTGNWREQGSAAPAGSGFTLAEGERLSRQFFPHEFHVAGGPGELEFCLEAEPDGDPAPDLRITAQPGAQAIDLDVSVAGGGCTKLQTGEKGLELAIEALRPVELLGARLSGFTQPIGMRDVDGSPKPSAGAWRRLNTELASFDTARPSSLDR